jgi:hypothetical protein
MLQLTVQLPPPQRYPLHCESFEQGAGKHWLEEQARGGTHWASLVHDTAQTESRHRYPPNPL